MRASARALRSVPGAAIKPRFARAKASMSSAVDRRAPAPAKASKVQGIAGVRLDV